MRQGKKKDELRKLTFIGNCGRCNGNGNISKL
jgi:hypothetical protein